MDAKTEIKDLLIKDLSEVGMPTDFVLELRGYSKRYNGTYNPNTKTIVLYANEKNGELREYHLLFLTLLHEATHHYQYNYEDGFMRLKGVMHNPKFYDMLNKAKEKAVQLNIIERRDYNAI